MKKLDVDFDTVMPLFCTTCGNRASTSCRFALLASASLHLAKPPATPDGPLPGVAVLSLGFLGVTANPTDRAFLFPFEIVSVHLLVVLVGAAYLARAKGKPRELPRDTGAKG